MNEAQDTILSKIKYYAETTPDKICIIEALSDISISYGSFWERILKYAVNIKAGKYYLMKTTQSIDHLVAFYGIQMAGSVAIPIEANTSQERIEELAEQFGATMVTEKIELSVEPTNISLPLPEKIACVICTTGTTGKSKGVMSSFRCRYCGADNVRYSYEITSEDIALVPQVLSHSGGLRRVEAMLVSGATVVIMGAAMLFGNVFGAIKKYHCNILQFVPAQVAQILNRAEKLLIEVRTQLRIVSVGSAMITENDKEKLRELLPGVKLFNDFGSTEAIGSAYFEWSAFPPKPGCVGIASIHSNIVILDENGEVMENSNRDNPGIVATEGDTIMSGYLNAPDLTAEVMHDGRIISADWGYYGEDGMLYIMGRKDDIIICGANKISPSEIEDAISLIPEVKECACVPKPDRVMENLPALFVVWKNEPLDHEIIIEYLESKIDRFKIPRHENIFYIDKLPRTQGTGKIIKRQLTERFMNEEDI